MARKPISAGLHYEFARRETMKRSRQEIFSQILKICLDGANKTKIVYQANLNFRTVNSYLEILIRNQHLIETGQGELVLYKTTRKGEDLLECIDKVNDTLFQK
ncbi:MAG TPA: winged helix-turn-helix domain-containing protein [Methanothrix sp.]|uniref:winged helix-turn-helix domain-containing protein n=1 Tax=Methanothrix sp. TaxID=90426 RepID=UPI002BBF6082|nr:winged helix-turn-helix domain-containing protein [Methanothrix sp.]MDI9416127.1 winged helix-turn-helix domain-containing protein [Euryarchaeota archaeon]HON36549.1 winged helix-turn-helix domain-containing protein [Methanothrix sp.]HRU76316.1 winged helix-turn-helix domain-containing protein [Methanothrix sp.]